MTPCPIASRPDVSIVVPCFNEARRLDVTTFQGYIDENPSVGFIFVNDGSVDDTLSVLRALESRSPAQVKVIDQTPNQGKGQAVRVGIVSALEQESRYVGYFDADLATPLETIRELVEVLDENPRIEIVVGARVALLGRQIARRAARHYAGRLFATAASLVLGIPIYDTQCGAKLFRSNAATAALFRDPFRSRWIFDVEILARHLAASRRKDAIYELPLRRWTDVGESRVRWVDFVRAIGEMAAIFHDHRVPRHADSVLRLLSAPFLRYVGVGGIGTLCHYAILVGAVELADASPVVATVSGALVGALVNYYLNYHLTFVSVARHRSTLPRFLLIAAVGTALNGLGMNYLGEVGVHYLAAQIVCTVIVLIFGYLANKLWTFGTPRAPAPKKEAAASPDEVAS